MGLDWRSLSLSGYLEALEAHNEAHDPDYKPEPQVTADKDRLKRLLNARAGGERREPRP
ncbi:hypothetical protein GTZ99_12475 [Novosphingobium sp. FSY-8]|uniref:Uncharacterized protein n=1 Tax=Novosphingobium ovatum TaxID=1908523 RepID=A0ABW9XFS6_9SPHN|nr:hypothetical protein [Novosphingobium ovatum]NBC37366.1 hypothetical protein [Novosphingobium ovatum]